MEKISVPFPLGDENTKTVIRSEEMLFFSNKSKKMVHQRTRSIVFGSFFNCSITSDRNTVSNVHLLTRMGQSSFP